MTDDPFKLRCASAFNHKCPAAARWIVPMMGGAEPLLVCGNHRRTYIRAYPIGRMEHAPRHPKMLRDVAKLAYLTEPVCIFCRTPTPAEVSVCFEDCEHVAPSCLRHWDEYFNDTSWMPHVYIDPLCPDCFGTGER